MVMELNTYVVRVLGGDTKLSYELALKFLLLLIGISISDICLSKFNDINTCVGVIEERVGRDVSNTLGKIIMLSNKIRKLEYVPLADVEDALRKFVNSYPLICRFFYPTSQDPYKA